jgi:hypothetical protein
VSTNGGAATAVPHEINSAAAEYCRRGWRVFPLRGKVPLASSRGFKDASADPERIATWPGGCNVGIATGSGLVVLDVDPKHGGDDALYELSSAHGELPLTVSAETGSGGCHYYFSSRTAIACSAGVLGPGLDIRGDGGYVVAPPSTHPDTGRPYVWDNAPDETPLAPPPGWLAALLKRDANGNGRPLEEWRALAAGGARAGERNARAAQLAGHLLARGVDPFVTLELVLAWDAQRNRPPLGGDEVVRVVRSIASKEAAKWD